MTTDERLSQDQITMREYLRQRRKYKQTLTRLWATPPYLPPAGWYPNRMGPGDWRWWDGQRWTGFTC